MREGVMEVGCGRGGGSWSDNSMMMYVFNKDEGSNGD